MPDIIVPTRTIWISIPQKKLRKLYWEHDFLSPKDARELLTKSHQIEHAIEQLRHAQSVVDKILLRTSHRTSP